MSLILPKPKKIITLRDYQAKGKKEIWNYYSMGVNRILYVLPTGGGKTVVFSDIAYDIAYHGKYVLVLAHRIELLEQCGNKLHENGVDFGYLNPKYTEKRSAHVQVGTCQTVIRRLKQLGIEPNLIIIDEAHRTMSKTYRDIIEHYKKARVLGVTATPIRGDGKCLGDIYEQMVVGPSIGDLISRGALVQPITYAPLGHLDLSGVKIVHGDYDKTELAKRLDRSSITGDAVAHYRKYCNNMPAVAFTASVDHAMHVAADFRAGGYKFEHIDGSMSGDERTNILNAVREGRLHGVTSVDLITEGFDAPMLMCGIMLRPTKSEGLYLQMVGRILRPFPGKDRAIILDHAGLSITHDLVTMDREWTLDQLEYEKRKRKKAAEKAVKVKQCPTCYRVHEPAPVCPGCGHVYKIIGRSPDMVDGDLTEVTPEAADVITAARRKEVSKAKTLEELKDIERIRGYKGRLKSIEEGGEAVEGWAEHVFYSRNAKQGMV